MSDDQSASLIAREIAVLLLRKGLLSERDILDSASQLDAEGEATAAHNMRCILLHAAAPSASDWNAERRRKHIRLVDDGTKDEG